MRVAAPEVPMPMVVERSAEVEIPHTVARLRTHAATARALLDELERATASSNREAPSLAGQLAEELARLGCRMLECAAVVSLLADELAGNRS